MILTFPIISTWKINIKSFYKLNLYTFSLKFIVKHGSNL